MDALPGSMVLDREQIPVLLRALTRGREQALREAALRNVDLADLERMLLAHQIRNQGQDLVLPYQTEV